MTKNKARKAAIRERAARTGERYTVARRAVELESNPSLGARLHRLMHRIPGVPRHVEGGLVPLQKRTPRPDAVRS